MMDIGLKTINGNFSLRSVVLSIKKLVYWQPVNIMKKKRNPYEHYRRNIRKSIYLDKSL